MLAALTSSAPVSVSLADEREGVGGLSEEAPLPEGAVAGAETEPLDLGELEVTGQGWTLQQETALRVIRTAYGNTRSMKAEDRDEWVCWLQRKTGSWFKYLHCARNGDLWAVGRVNGLDAPTVPIGGYGRILVSERPANRYKLERAMASLEGSSEYDMEFLRKVVDGEEPLRDPPSDEEIERFARAYAEVDRLHREGASEDAQIGVIEAQGLTLERYNHIAAMTQEYDSIERAVASRLDG